MASPAPGLDDPVQAAFAWRRYRAILRWMTLASTFIVAGGIWLLDLTFGPLSWVAIAAAIGGFGGTALMTSALMGLVFMSSGTGHDEQVGEID